MKRCIAVVAAAFFSLGATEWHYPLYLDGGQPHQSRRSIEVANPSPLDLEGEPLRIPVRALGLAGIPAREIRVLDAEGFELLHTLRPAGETVAEDAVLTVPVTAKAGKSTALWIYWNNPAAWSLPDEFPAPESSFTDSFETGEGGLPPGWNENASDELHRNLRSTRVARSGGQSLETRLEAGAKPSWVKFFREIPVRPGMKFHVTGYVKGEDVKGGVGAGYFLHIGPRGTEWTNAQNRWENFGTFDWKRVEFTGTVPEGADSMILGTVLNAASGRAWFDDVEVKFESPELLTFRPGKVETLTLKRGETVEKWELPQTEWPERYRFEVFNTAPEECPARLCSIPVNRLTRANYPDSAFRLLCGGREIPFLIINGTMIFELPPLAARTSQELMLYLAADRRNREAGVELAQASSILSDMESGNTGGVDPGRYAALLESKANIAGNPSFEDDSSWSMGGEKTADAFKTTGFVPGGLFGKRMARLDIPENASDDWYGFRQVIPVRQGQTYLVAGWVESDDPVGIWIHEFNRSNPASFNNTASDVPGAGWRPFAVNVTARNADSALEVHLTAAKGKRSYDGVIVAESAVLSHAKFESASDRGEAGAFRVAQTNPLVKIFEETIPRDTGKPLAVSLARNEAESLQLAVRSNREYPELSVTASAPRSESGTELPAPQIGIVGLVKVDAESRYYQFTGTPLARRCIPAVTVPERYPDPILPRSEFHLEPDRTRGIFLTIRAPHGATPGIYRGEITFRAGNRVLRTLPYEVKVWNFTLPDRPEITAIFDNRFGTGREFKAFTEMDAAHFLAQSRISLDEIPVKPEFRLENGEVKADFTRFDEAAKLWFEEWNVPRAYLPIFRELFGWGHPPRPFLGVEPYPGEYPYPGVDRGKFTPEYRRVCQAALKLMMNHLRKKGWDDRFLLYVSDEPHAQRPGIIEQMSALCDMFHEAEPEVKIYASTWGYVPEWKGKLDVWGIGVQGQISEKDLQTLKESGAEILITTDGQMCLDTPYCAVERLLPLYAWKYGAGGYEFWGADWLTRNPFEWGIHTVHFQADVPGFPLRVRYPNGDGYVFYPGNLIGAAGPVSTVRLESLRDGIEDFSYCALLEKLVKESGDAEGAKLLEEARRLVTIPNAGGRKSEMLLPDPERLTTLRDRMGETIDRLQKK